MGDKTKIEWADASWNPLGGCTPVSEGCRNCYAASTALRLEAMGQTKYAGTAKRASDGRAVFTGRINLDEKTLSQPLRWTKPRRVFVNSMSDLFHEAVPVEFIGRVFNVMGQASKHTFQVLTKRPERMAEVVSAYYEATGQAPFPNVWLGTSVEHQEAADERIPHLLQVPAAVRFLSCEPLLGWVHLSPWTASDGQQEKAEWLWSKYGSPRPIDWVIVGGESGPNARPMHPDWARWIRDECEAARIPFFFKQWGAWAAYNEFEGNGVPVPPYTGWGCLTRGGEWYDQTTTWNGRQGDPRDDYEYTMIKVGKKAAGRLLDGQLWEQFPEGAR